MCLIGFSHKRQNVLDKKIVIDNFKEEPEEGMTYSNVQDQLRHPSSGNLNEPDQELDQVEGWSTELNERAILSVRGPDSQKFLQDVTTADLSKMREDKELRALYALMLNPKGRIFTDCLVVKPLLANQDGDDVEFWVDVERKHLQTIIEYFRTYSLRKTIQVEDYSDVLTGNDFHNNNFFSLSNAK